MLSYEVWDLLQIGEEAMTLKNFVFTWPDGSTKEGPGTSQEEAFKNLGFNPSVMNTLESIEVEPLVYN